MSASARTPDRPLSDIAAPAPITTPSDQLAVRARGTSPPSESPEPIRADVDLLRRLREPRRQALSYRYDHDPELGLVDADLRSLSKIWKIDQVQGLAVLDAGVTQAALDEALVGTPWIGNYSTASPFAAIAAGCLRAESGCWGWLATDVCAATMVDRAGIHDFRVSVDPYGELLAGDGPLRPRDAIVTALVLRLHRRPECTMGFEVSAPADQFTQVLDWAFQIRRGPWVTSTIEVAWSIERGRWIVGGCLLTPYGSCAEAIAWLTGLRRPGSLATFDLGLTNAQMPWLHMRPRATPPAAAHLEVVVPATIDELEALQHLADEADVLAARPARYRVVDASTVAAQIPLPPSTSMRGDVVDAVCERLPRGSVRLRPTTASWVWRAPTELT